MDMSVDELNVVQGYGALKVDSGEWLFSDLFSFTVYGKWSGAGGIKIVATNFDTGPDEGARTDSERGLIGLNGNTSPSDSSGVIPSGDDYSFDLPSAVPSRLLWKRRMTQPPNI
jgi:hypothetical protein